MRAIIIEEERFAEICELMKAHALSLGENNRTAGVLQISDQAWKAAVDDIHRTMHFHFVRWAQSHGASCVPK